MLDTQPLRKDIDVVTARLKDHSYVFDVAGFAALEAEHKTIQTHTEELQARRNSLSRQVGILKDKGENASGMMAEVSGIGDELKTSATQLDVVQAKLQGLMLLILNLPHESMLVDRDEMQNVEVRRKDTPRTFGSPVKNHVDLGAALGLDFDADAKPSDTRFTVLEERVVRLHRTLAQFTLDTRTLEHGHTGTYVPYIVNAASMRGTGQLPKFGEDLSRVPRKMGHSAEEGDGERIENFYLIPVVEVPLTDLVRNEIVTADTLPMVFAAHSLYFRSEAGSYGKDTRGMIRQHQFDKVEVVQIVQPETSAAALGAITNCAENILHKLELPLRTVILYTGDTGFDSTKAYGIEVWTPARNTYREISSCSNMGDSQARRVQARFRNAQGKSELVHTLNGSGLTVGRTLVALLENYQNADDSVTVPTALRPYLGD